MGLLTRSLVLGLAAGGRSSAGVAVPVLVATRGRTGPGAAVLRLVAGAALAGEAVVDKLPATPSRLLWPVLGARVAAGAVGAAALSVLERRRPPAHLVALLAGAVGGWAGSVGGASWRASAAAAATDLLQPDVRAALVEDAVVLSAVAGLVASSPAPRADEPVRLGHRHA